ncbi:MAG: DUF1186 domain-containing protein [Thermoplasmata archaeon]|nr:DUF1186 domain-containing protein [Thermoplasmata archaeon]
MEPNEILSELEYVRGHFPREALMQAVERRDEMVPVLLAVLERASGDVHALEEDPDYVGHIFAMLLLAQFREARAYPLVVDLFSHPGDVSETIGGDFVTEDLPRVLASLCGGDTSLIERLVEDPVANEYVRAAGLAAFLVLAVNGARTRVELIDHYLGLFRGRLERRPSFVWDELATCASCLSSGELFGEIERAFSARLIDTRFNGLRDLAEVHAIGWDGNRAILRDDPHYSYVDDTIGSTEWWACFKPEWGSRGRRPTPPGGGSKPKKPGRNEPCPCGSGKKYKRCCGSIAARRSGDEVG